MKEMAMGQTHKSDIMKTERVQKDGRMTKEQWQAKSG